MHIANANEKRIVQKIEYFQETKGLFYNSTFTNVSCKVYEFAIGTYQLLKKYLKYINGRELSIHEIEHLEKVIKVIQYTLMFKNRMI
ncbi:hypothetical protein [Borrelia hermsii]|uniref:Uncharacterized protein n=1 Tax=Borrelia hermsii TaxID=140 RepID=A0AAN0X6R4_BORHE|nr:hypothetical protein [Borrelia hermsii]AMR76234.1 hypothetical protein A0V01_06515 [Borrelia hermsii]UPA08416.1 hypothetical protein bhDAH_001076 [Borrelia hermsii DAH]